MRSIANKRNEDWEDSKPQSRQSLRATPSTCSKKINEARAYEKDIAEKDKISFEVVGQKPFSKHSKRSIVKSRPATAEKPLMGNQNGTRQSKRSGIARDQQEPEKKIENIVISRPDSKQSKQSEVPKKVNSENAIRYIEIEDQVPESRVSQRSKFLNVEKPESSKSDRSKLSKSPQLLNIPGSQATKSRHSGLRTDAKVDSLKVYIKELEDLLREEKIKRISSETILKKFLENKQ